LRDVGEVQTVGREARELGIADEGGLPLFGRRDESGGRFGGDDRGWWGMREMERERSGGERARGDEAAGEQEASLARQAAVERVEQRGHRGKAGVGSDREAAQDDLVQPARDASVARGIGGLAVEDATYELGI